MSLSDLIPPPSVIVTILENRRLRKGFRGLYRKYRAFTMIHEAAYVNNLELAGRFAAVAGCGGECGVWRGGVIARVGEGAGARPGAIFVCKLLRVPARRGRAGRRGG